MNNYSDYLSRWQRQFGEAAKGLAPYWEEGRPKPVAVGRLEQTAHDRLWHQLLALYVTPLTDEAMAAMRPIEVELLVWGLFFHPEQLEKWRLAKKVKDEGKKRKR